ncbi:hypothetical protein Tco_0438495, partial [Tanacetum coccineum]
MTSLARHHTLLGGRNTLSSPEQDFASINWRHQWDLTSELLRAQNDRGNGKCPYGVRCFSKPWRTSYGMVRPPAQRMHRQLDGSARGVRGKVCSKAKVLQGPYVVMHISSFMSNSKCPKLARRFSDQVPKTVTEMMNREDDFVKSEEVFKNTELPRGGFPEKGTTTQFRGSRPPRHSYGSGPSMTDIHPRRDHYQPYVSPRASDRRYDNRRHDHRRQEVNHLRLDSLTKLPSEILAMELQLQLPPCPLTVAPPKKKTWIESGKLNHLIKDVRQRGNNWGRLAENNNGRGKQFSVECRELLIRLLKDNMDVFAWQPSDMTRIPKLLIRHTLNVNNSVSPVVQKRRVLATEKTRVVTKEVEEWVKAGIVRPV